MSQNTHIAENIDRVRETIAAACACAGRAEDSVQLVAVSKKKPAEDILAAIKAGVQDFGENRVEEALTKIPEVLQQTNASPKWHMIGHIQSRKARDVVPLFDYVHSIDSLKLARKLSGLAEQENKTLDVFLEINISGEAEKYGFNAYEWQKHPKVRDSIWQAVSEINELPALNVIGLMTMAPFVDDAEETRPMFAGLAELRAALSESLSIVLPHLSMGMTNDYSVAIEEGATMVRVGTAIFGARPTI